RLGREIALGPLLLQERLDVRVGQQLRPARGLVIVDQLAPDAGRQRRRPFPQQRGDGIPRQPRPPPGRKPSGNRGRGRERRAIHLGGKGISISPTWTESPKIFGSFFEIGL